MFVSSMYCLLLFFRLSKHSDDSFHTETVIVKVHYTGKVDWVTIASTRTFCSINVENFPKDKHTCDVTFTTWLHQDNEQKLQILGRMDSCEIEHLTWRLTFTGLGGNDSLYRCHQYLQNQSYVRYIATLERLNTKFDMYTFVVPNLFISVVSVFTICFPRGDSNGPAFGMMCLLALVIQLGTLYQVLPDTAFSKVGQSIANLTIVVAVETLFSVINMGIGDIFSELMCLRNLIRQKRKQHNDVINSGDPQSNDSDSDTLKLLAPGTSKQLPSGNPQGLNYGDDTKSGAQKETTEPGNLDPGVVSDQTRSNIPKPVTVKDGDHIKMGAKKEGTDPSNLDPGVVSDKNRSNIPKPVTVKEGDHIKMGAKKEGTDPSNLDPGVVNDQNGSNITEPVKVKNGSACTLEVILPHV